MPQGTPASQKRGNSSMMGDKRMLHLRRQLQAVHRLRLRRTYASETEGQEQTYEEQVAFLRAQDQKTLLETKQQADLLIENIHKLTNEIARLPTTIQKDPNIQPYTLGFLRSKIQNTPKIADAVIVRAEHVKHHLTDLQFEPYPDRSKSSTAAWEGEIAGMSKQEKEERLRNLQLKEEGDLARLKKDSWRLVEIVREIDAMSKKSGVSVDDAVRSKNPFGSAADTAKVLDKTPVKEARGEDKPASGPVPAIQDLQKRLEADYGGINAGIKDKR